MDSITCYCLTVIDKQTYGAAPSSPAPLQQVGEGCLIARVLTKLTWGA